MNIDRRHLVLPALAVGLLGIVPALATSADEDAVAKSVRSAWPRSRLTPKHSTRSAQGN